MNPTLSFTVGYFRKIPFIELEAHSRERIIQNVRQLVEDAQSDWDAYERSREFGSLPLLSENIPTLEKSYSHWTIRNQEVITRTRRLEEENNRIFINAYGLAEEFEPTVPLDQITLTVNPAYRYRSKRWSEEKKQSQFCRDTMAELVSYAIGCMMGRYSLDKYGLIYARSRGEGFDPEDYTRFLADQDGIVPITEWEWFSDDAAERLVEFISVVWNRKHLEDNLSFLAHQLLPSKRGRGASRELLREYLSTHFFKDHLKTYNRRPLYWLFTSGRQKAFQCLVYLHRYNEGTLARMRTEYVIPLQGMMMARAQQLEKDRKATTLRTHQRRLQKEREKLLKHHVELQEFDEKLRHFADRRIQLDLDDGVKVNYYKFGDLLAEVKAVTGRRPEIWT